MGKIRKRKKWIAKPTKFSEALRLARTKHRGFTQKSVSEATGIPRPRLSEYETGARVPSYKTMYKLTRYYLDIGLIHVSNYGNIKCSWREAVRDKHVTNFPYMKEH